MTVPPDRVPVLLKGEFHAPESPAISGPYAFGWLPSADGVPSSYSPEYIRLTIHCEYPGGCMEPTCVSFRLSPRYAIRTAREAHAWFLRMMREHEEFEVETDRAGELPVPFWSETVRRVVVE